MKNTSPARKTPLAALVLFLVIQAGAASAGSHGLVEDGWDDTIRLAVSKVSDTDFDEGLALVGEYIRAFPENPGGYFFRAAALQEKMQKLNDLGGLGAFYESAETCRALCRRRLRENPGDVIAKLFLGGIHGYMGLVEAKRRNLVKAFLDGVEAKKHLEAVAAERPEIPDTYFGLGTLYYFASRKSGEGGRILSWIIRKFITNGRDMKDEGVEMIKRAVIGGSLSRDYALSSLMWINLYEKRYDQAEQIALGVSGRFPRDAASRWVLGRVALDRGDCAEARRRFEEIVDITGRKGIPVSRYPDVEVAIRMADLCESLGKARWREAETAAGEIARWLDGDPKITIEYQDEKNLLARWKEEMSRVRETLRLARGG